jgi:hypothetical protein
MNNSQKEIKPGKYKHYKGKDYQVIGVAQHSEDGNHVVVYKPLYGEQGLWVRPLEMFAEDVIIEGEPIPRFAFVE